MHNGVDRPEQLFNENDEGTIRLVQEACYYDLKGFIDTALRMTIDIARADLMGCL